MLGSFSLSQCRCSGIGLIVNFRTKLNKRAPKMNIDLKTDRDFFELPNRNVRIMEQVFYFLVSSFCLMRGVNISYLAIPLHHSKNSENISTIEALVHLKTNYCKTSPCQLHCPMQSLSCECNKIICTVWKMDWLWILQTLMQRSQLNWCKAEKFHWLLSIVHQFNWFAHTIYFQK